MKHRSARDKRTGAKIAKGDSMQRVTRPPDLPLGRVVSIVRGIEESKVVLHKKQHERHQNLENRVRLA